MSVAVTLSMLVALVGIGVAVNNVPRRAPDERELRQALDGSIDWLVAHRAQVQTDYNFALWWMLASADADLEGDARLTSLVTEFKTKTREASLSRSPWRTYFDGPDVAPPNLADQASKMPGYNAFFLFGLTCQTQLAKLDVVQEELAPGYCPSVWMLTPHCATHQLMGLLWGLQNRCDAMSPVLAGLVVNRIRHQLTWDFRVDDAYIQRVLMIAAPNDWRTALKPVWIARVLDAQLEDGGWDGDARLLPLGASRYLMLGPQGFSIRRPISNFHSTAQAVLLLAHLLDQHPDRQANQMNNLATWYRFPADAAADARRQ